MLVLSKDHCLKTCNDMLEQIAYDTKRAKSPDRKRQLKRSNEFWEAIKHHLSEPDNMAAFYARYVRWSHATFGNKNPFQGLLKFAREIKEANEAPDDITEYADMLMCVLFAYSCKFPDKGFMPLLKALNGKLDVNVLREWIEQPDGTFQSIK